MQFLQHLRDRLEALFQEQTAHVVVAEAGAFAQRRRPRLHFVTQRQREQVFDQPGARSATGRGLAGAAHGVEAARPCLDGLHHPALGHAVATADFRIIGKGGNGTIMIRKSTSRSECLSEDQRLADGGNILPLLQQVKVPAAIGSIAIEHCADQLVFADHHAFVDATRRIAHHDVLGPRTAAEIARAEQVDA